MAFIIVYTTHGSEEEARRVSLEMIQAHLAACANVFPIQSMYWWQGAVEEGAEWVSILKTASVLWEALKRAIEQTHPYDVPCIMKIEVSANEAYERWIHAETAGHSPSGTGSP